MDFASDPIARRIREAASRGTLSHALLFSGSGDLHPFKAVIRHTVDLPACAWTMVRYSTQKKISPRR